MLHTILILASLSSVIPENTQQNSYAFVIPSTCSLTNDPRLKNSDHTQWHAVELVNPSDRQFFSSTAIPNTGLIVKKDGMQALAIIKEAFKNDPSCGCIRQVTSYACPISQDRVLRRVQALKREIDRQLKQHEFNNKTMCPVRHKYKNNHR